MTPESETSSSARFSAAASAVGNPELRRWRDSGGRVMGYFCSAMPEELITAAGLMPFRIRGTGSEGTELADAFFSSINCTFVRHAFNLALKGEYDFLDGLAMFNSCDNVRRIYDHWTRELQTPFTHFMSLPRKAEPPQVDFFRGELENLKKHIESHFGTQITDDDLHRAIHLHNQSRQHLRELCDLRRRDDPPITGSEMLAAVVAGTAMPKQRFNEILAALLDEKRVKGSSQIPGARLMIIGGILDDPRFIDIIENQGALVVTDSLCFGTRNYWLDVNENDDPLTALARYYVAERPSCPRTFGLHEKRADFVRDLIEKFRVQGVIFERLTFCDVWGFEAFPLIKGFEKRGVPVLMLDREYTLGAIGQLRTRIQAFLESLAR